MCFNENPQVVPLILWHAFGLFQGSWVLALTLIKVLIVQMEKQLVEMTKQRDLAQSRFEDYMKMVEHDESSKVSQFNRHIIQ